MGLRNFCVGFQPVGEINSGYLKALTTLFLKKLDIESLILPSLDYPDYSFNKKRIQYNAGLIINKLETMEFKGCNKVIALIDADLFIPVFSHVLGEARMGGKCALISLYRLKQSHKRTAKVALHEFGHLMNLGHCHEKACVMNFSKSIEQLDLVSIIFCKYCLDQIKYLLQTFIIK